MQSEMTTPKECKRCIEQIMDSVLITDREKFDEAISGLKNLQFLLCQAYARERMWEEECRETTGLEFSEFFKHIMDKIQKADAEGADDFFDVFPEGVDG